MHFLSACEEGSPLRLFGRLRAIACVEIMPRLKKIEQFPRLLSRLTLFVRIINGG